MNLLYMSRPLQNFDQWWLLFSLYDSLADINISRINICVTDRYIYIYICIYCIIYIYSHKYIPARRGNNDLSCILFNVLCQLILFSVQEENCKHRQKLCSIQREAELNFSVRETQQKILITISLYSTQQKSFLILTRKTINTIRLCSIEQESEMQISGCSI